MRKIIALLFCITTLITGCKTQRNESRTPIKNPIDISRTIKKTKFFFKEINKESSFQQLKINSKIKVETERVIPPINSVIYIKKDEKIWINLSSYFLTVGRGLAEKETFKGYIKMPEKKAIEGSYKNVQSLLKIDFLDYPSLQKLLLGKTFLPVSHKDYTLTKNSLGYTLHSKKEVHFQERKAYHISLDYSNDFQLQKVKMSNPYNTESITILLSERVHFDDLKIPRSVKIIIKELKTSVISIENTKFDNSEMRTPFRIPKNYQKVQL